MEVSAFGTIFYVLACEGDIFHYLRLFESWFCIDIVLADDIAVISQVVKSE
jgi:hypothetical protein